MPTIKLFVETGRKSVWIQLICFRMLVIFKYIYSSSIAYSEYKKGSVFCSCGVRVAKWKMCLEKKTGLTDIEDLEDTWGNQISNESISRD